MLTPVTVDPSILFLTVLNKALSISFLLRRKARWNPKPLFGVVTVPTRLASSPPISAPAITIPPRAVLYGLQSLHAR